MKRALVVFVVAVAAVLAVSLWAAAQDAGAPAEGDRIKVQLPPGTAPESKELPTMKDKISYIIGLDVGENLKRQYIEVDPQVLAKGVADALSGAQPLLSEAQIQDAMQLFQQEHQAKVAAERSKAAADSLAAGQAFLAENAKQEGVVTLESGLQYMVVEEGSGERPKAGDTVTVNYRGTLVDGTEFDSSYKRGEPATFPVMGVIPGWTQALQLMKVGSKWRLFIPADLAYGESGMGPISPNSTLIFDVELIGIEVPEAAAPPVE